VLAEDQTHTFTTNAVFFDNQLQLLESQIQSGGGGDGGGDTETNSSDLTQ